MKQFPTCFRAQVAFALTAGFALLAGDSLADEKDASKNDQAASKQVKVGDITLNTPKHWEEQAPSNKLRLAQFAIPPAKGDTEPIELTVFSFGGGGVDDNIARWIQQFEPEGRKTKVTKGKSPQGEYVIADLSGTYLMPVGPPVLRKTKPMPDSRMLAAILIVPQKGVYYLKLAGPQKTIDAEAKAFRAAFGADESAEVEYKSNDDAQ